MKIRNLATLAALSLGAFIVGAVVKTFLPQRVGGTPSIAPTASPVQSKGREPGALPDVEVSFLRCGSVTIPEAIAVRGGSLFAPCEIVHSAVLVRHPRATFLYDTGLCSDIYLALMPRPFLFRKTLGNFVFEQSLAGHLGQLGIETGNLDFALLSHLHWDHVSGIPDIPGVPLRVNRVEYEAARLGLLDAQQGLVRELMGDNALEFFDLDGPAYEGFRSSLDLFGDGSVVLVPLPGHTAGNSGMFINRANGSRLFLLGDATWVAENYTRPATMHPFIWSQVTADDATARQTLIDLYLFRLSHPEVPMIAMHDAALQESWMQVERLRALSNSL
jgi:glyoxylase-like metal-dependent hydrolase (beta-lactamase superfamily II)